MTEVITPGSAHLRTLREATGLTAQAAADLCGCSLRTWQYWESPTSTQPIKPDVLAVLGAMLDRKHQDVESIVRSGEGNRTVTLTRYASDKSLIRDHPDYPYGTSLWNSTVAAVLEALGDRAVAVWSNEVE